MSPSLIHANKTRSGVSNIIFAASVVVLIIIAGSGFGLYATSISHSSTTSTTSSSSTEMMTGSSTTAMSTSNSDSNCTCAYEFTPESGAMISNAWVVLASLGMNQYAVSIHAEGLERNGTYFVEGALSSGSMAVVGISSESMNMNTTSASEFQADTNGTGTFWIVLNNNPSSTFESLELTYLPGMSMQNATVVATTSLGMMGSSSSTMTTSSESSMT
jgi:hypothetical protein